MNDQLTLGLVIAGTFVLTLFALFLIAVLIVQKNKQNKYEAEKAVQNYKQQNQILRIRLEAQEDAMNQLSKEIHDNLNQLLALTQSNLYMLIDKVQEPEHNMQLQSINKLVGQIIVDLQNLSHSLNGSFINSVGLLEALNNEVEYINAAQKLMCQLVVEGDEPPLTPENELLVFRIAQEAIHNALKHSQATILNIQLINDGTKTRLSIADNGVGFDNKYNSNNGIGFINMNQRAQLLQGSLDVISEQNNGTQILLTLDNVNYG